MRYLIALIVAATIIVAVVAYEWHVGAEHERAVRMTFSDVGGELPPSLKIQIQIADFLATFWPVWVPLVIAGCILAARKLLPSTKKPQDV